MGHMIGCNPGSVVSQGNADPTPLIARVVTFGNSHTDQPLLGMASILLVNSVPKYLPDLGCYAPYFHILPVLLLQNRALFFTLSMD